MTGVGRGLITFTIIYVQDITMDHDFLSTDKNRMVNVLVKMRGG